MKKEEIQLKLNAVLATMEEISVKGMTSVSKLGACMQYIKAMAEEVVQDDDHDEQGKDV